MPMTLNPQDRNLPRCAGGGFGEMNLEHTVGVLRGDSFFNDAIGKSERTLPDSGRALSTSISILGDIDRVLTISFEGEDSLRNGEFQFGGQDPGDLGDEQVLFLKFVKIAGGELPLHSKSGERQPNAFKQPINLFFEIVEGHPILMPSKKGHR